MKNCQYLGNGSHRAKWSKIGDWKFQALKKQRYFTSANCPLSMKLNSVAWQVVKHHKQINKAHRPFICDLSMVANKSLANIIEFIVCFVWSHQQ